MLERPGVLKKFLEKKEISSYTDIFSKYLVQLGEKNPNITAITAAMSIGTGIHRFAEKFEDRMFVKKADQKKALYKKRIKIVTSVYTTAMVLLLAFVGVNIATMASLQKDITTNTQTIQSQQEQIELLEQNTPGASTGNYQISLNEPRDYSEDKKELTFLDKLTILFRNLFG